MSLSASARVTRTSVRIADTARTCMGKQRDNACLRSFTPLQAHSLALDAPLLNLTRDKSIGVHHSGDGGALYIF